ncbi:MAG: hypothetical protein SVN78_03260 [Deferribacterota bacterium]|nr:hypothetical protein [Deferribacterota bacterium]
MEKILYCLLIFMLIHNNGSSPNKLNDNAHVFIANSITEDKVKSLLLSELIKPNDLLRENK